MFGAFWVWEPPKQTPHTGAGVSAAASRAAQVTAVKGGAEGGGRGSQVSGVQGFSGPEP